MTFTHALKRHQIWNGHRQANSPSVPLTKTAFLNIALAGLALFFLTYAIIQANVVAAETYSIKTYHDRLLSLQETNASLLADRSVIEDPIAIDSFAKEHGMVSAGKDIVYLFDANNVALGAAR